jgi:hypothetical protein
MHTITNINRQISSIPTYVSSFMEKNSSAINHLGRKAYNNSSSPVALNAFRHIASNVLTSACDHFVSDQENDLSHLDRYLFGSLKIAALKILNEGKQSTLICPACKYYDQISFLVQMSEKLACKACQRNYYEANDEKEKLFYEAFGEHSRSGFRCDGCKRFIPASSQDRDICPYPDCQVKNSLLTVKEMAHPIIRVQNSNISYDMPLRYDWGWTNPDATFESEEVHKELRMIKKCLEEQIKTLHYKGYPNTYISRLCMYKAFKNLLATNLDEMIPYLSGTRKTNGGGKIQVKVFQEFIRELEKELPFSYQLRDEKCEIKSITDERLHLFAGESVFEAKVGLDGKIPNNTKEIYIGGRNGYHHLPYYIGELLEVKNLENNMSLLDRVVEYSCVNIKMQPSIEPETKVVVKHLRIVPHYSMGGFIILNRIKKKITDRVKILMREND